MARLLAAALFLALAAGCGGSDDGAKSDLGRTDVVWTDRGTQDPGPVDPGTPDLGPADPGVPDPGPVDPGVPDLALVDPGEPDPGPADVGVFDPGPSDLGVQDPGPAPGTKTAGQKCKDASECANGMSCVKGQLTPAHCNLYPCKSTAECQAIAPGTNVACQPNLATCVWQCGLFGGTCPGELYCDGAYCG